MEDWSKQLMDEHEREERENAVPIIVMSVFCVVASIAIALMILGLLFSIINLFE